MSRGANIQKNVVENENFLEGLGLNKNEEKEKTKKILKQKNSEVCDEDDKNDDVCEMIKKTFIVCSFQNDIEYFLKTRISRIYSYKDISKLMEGGGNNLLNPEHKILEEQRMIISVFDIQERYMILKLAQSPRLKKLLSYFEELKEEPPAKYLCHELDISRHKLKALLLEIFKEIDGIYKIYMEISCKKS